MSDHDKAKSLVLRFRHYATEFRNARNHNLSEGEQLTLPDRVGQAIYEAIVCRAAPDVFVNQFKTHCEGRLDYPRNMLCTDAIGYKAEIRKIPPIKGKNIHILESHAVYLKPGWISTVWPRVFQDVFVGLKHPVYFLDEYKASDAVVMYRSDVFGYQAQACDLLADWIENHAIDEQSTDDHTADGLDEEGKAFTWGGVRFDRLTQNMIRVLGLLLDERRKGRPNVPTKYIRTRAEVAIDSGMKSQVFKLNRKSGPKLHPVSEIVQDNGDATYRLIDPNKVPGKIPDRSGDHS